MLSASVQLTNCDCSNGVLQLYFVILGGVGFAFACNHILSRPMRAQYNAECILLLARSYVEGIF